MGGYIRLGEGRDKNDMRGWSEKTERANKTADQYLK